MALAALAVLAACEEDVILEGDRFDPRAPFDPTVAEQAEQRAAPISLPATVNHARWSHPRGSAQQRITHPQLGADLSRVWGADIGRGDERRHRLTATPVAEDSRIFTLDSRATVTATSTDGERLWQADLTPSYAGRDDASGGGLAVADGRLYVATGFGRVTALDTRTGDELWSHRFDAPVTAAPTVSGNSVYVVAADSSAWALDAGNGRVRWQLPGTPSSSTMAGGSSPAVSGGTTIFPFPSGAVTGALNDGGAELWATTVAGQRLGRAHSGIPGLLGLPVIDGNTAYVGNHSGRIAALDIETGERRWTADEGATGPVWPVGGSLFVLTDEGRLARLSASSGDQVWQVQLPHFRSDDEDRRAEIVTHHGPVLAGGRLVVTSNDGVLRGFDPVSGELVERLVLPASATTAPIVVAGTLYVVTSDGTLHAYR